MASTLLVNLSMRSPRGSSKHRKKSFRISSTFRSLLSSRDNTEEVMDPDALPRIDMPQRESETALRVAGHQQQDGSVKKSNGSSQRFPKSPRTRRRVRRRVVQEDAEIEWVTPAGSSVSLQHQEIGGNGDDIHGVVKAEKPHEVTPEGRSRRQKNSMHPGYQIYGKNRSAGSQKLSKVKTRGDTPTRGLVGNDPDEIEEAKKLYASDALKVREADGNPSEDLRHHGDSSRKGRHYLHENQATTLSRLKVVKKENKELKEDCDVLKSVIRRLNKEISFYQQKLRSKYPNDPRKVPFYSSSNTNSNEEDDQDDLWLSHPSVKMQPLLVAYDEIISEKVEIIKEYDLTMQHFKQKFQDVVQENDKLHKERTDARQKAVSQEEWQFLHDAAALVLEENDLLHQQISVLKHKLSTMQSKHKDRESRLESKVSLLEEETTRLKFANTQLETHCKTLAEQIAQVSRTGQTTITVGEHEDSVKECKRLFEDLKANYAEDRQNLKDKIEAMQKEKDRLIIEMTDLGAENARLQGNILDLENMLATNHANLKKMYAKMEESAKAKDATVKTVAEMMEVAKAVIQDRESLEKTLVEQKSLNEHMMSVRFQESMLVNKLREKFKLIEDAHKTEIERHVARNKELEKVLDSIGDRHQGDMIQLKELIQEKTKIIDMLMAEKNQLAADLETVWHASTKWQAAK